MVDENTPTNEVGISKGLEVVEVEEVGLGQVKPPPVDLSKPEEDKAPTRQRIVYILLAIMAGLILLPFAMTGLQMSIGCKDAAKECKDIMTKELWEFVHIAFPALTGLLGTAIGFYFERNSK